MANEEQTQSPLEMSKIESQILMTIMASKNQELSLDFQDLKDGGAYLDAMAKEGFIKSTLDTEKQEGSKYIATDLGKEVAEKMLEVLPEPMRDYNAGYFLTSIKAFPTGVDFKIKDIQGRAIIGNLVRKLLIEHDLESEKCTLSEIGGPYVDRMNDIYFRSREGYSLD